MTRRVFGALIAIGAGAGGFALGLWVASFGHRTTTSLMSPDETMRVRLVDFGPEFKLDRNFTIKLERRATGMVETVYHSYDEPGNGHEGSERFLWSKDGTKVLLVSRHLDVREDLFLDNGDQAYWLYDVAIGQTWSNSALRRDLDPLTAEQLAGIEFTEPVILKPRAKVDPDSPEKRE